MTQAAAPPSQTTPSDAEHAPTGRHAVWPRRMLIGLIVLLCLVVLIRLVLDPIAAHFTRKALNEAEGIEGRFDDVHVTVFPPGYEIRDLALIESPGGNWKRPLVRAERIGVALQSKRLLEAELSARMRIEEPKILFVKREAGPPSQEKPEVPNVDVQLRELIPARVDRIEVVRGDFTYRDMTQKGHPDLDVHRIEVAAENLATRPERANGQPATVSASALVGKSGDLSVYVSVNPFGKQLEFAGSSALRGLKLAELHDFTKALADVKAPEGTIDVFVEFKANDGYITGGVKPVLKNVEVRPAKDDLGTRVKAWLADAALDIVSDRVPGRNAVATTIPIKGRLDDPKAQVWPTILSTIRNAFVIGISSGFSNLPPPTSDEKQGVLEQAAQALQEDKGPAKAQPEGESK